MINNSRWFAELEVDSSTPIRATLERCGWAKHASGAATAPAPIATINLRRVIICATIMPNHAEGSRGANFNRQVGAELRLFVQTKCNRQRQAVAESRRSPMTG